MPTLPKNLSDLIGQFNQLQKNDHVQRLYYLQRINHIAYGSTEPEVIAWRNGTGKVGLEAHLQRYGIHRDSSPLLQSIEFANAIRQASPHKSAPQQDLYSAMQKRDVLLKGDVTGEAMADYVDQNLAIMDNYDKDAALRAKVDRSAHFLALSYAKIDAIQGFVDQNFPEYQSDVLGNIDGNNKNFIFGIDGESDKAAIRVERRANLGKEQQLQLYPVSEYFSEDYATLMVPFPGDGGVGYRPVIIGQFAKEGDLLHYAEGLQGKNNSKEIAGKAQAVFGQLADFNIKLIASGHYHPDIKLSNFLWDGKRLVISDRKTFGDQIELLVSDVETSPAYAPPEFAEGLDFSSGSPQFNRLAYENKINMPSYMAYQTGMALREFMFKSMGLEERGELENDPLIGYVSNPSEDVKNISALVQELTRPVPGDRLSMENFQILMSQVNLPHDEFMAKLEKLSPKEKLTNHEDIDYLKAQIGDDLVRELLMADDVGPDLGQRLDDLAALPRFRELWENDALWGDPRLGIHPKFKEKLGLYTNGQSEFEPEDVVDLDAINGDVVNSDVSVDEAPATTADVAFVDYARAEPFLRSSLPQLRGYVRKVEDALLTADLAKSSWDDWLLHKITGGLVRVPEVTTIAELAKDNKLPIMDGTLKDIVDLAKIQGYRIFPGLDAEQQRLLNQVVSPVQASVVSVVSAANVVADPVPPKTEVVSAVVADIGAAAVANAALKPALSDVDEEDEIVLGNAVDEDIDDDVVISDGPDVDFDADPNEGELVTSTPEAIVNVIERGNKKDYVSNAKEKLKQIKAEKPAADVANNAVANPEEEEERSSLSP